MDPPVLENGYTCLHFIPSPPKCHVLSTQEGCGYNSAKCWWDTQGKYCYSFSDTCVDYLSSNACIRNDNCMWAVGICVDENVHCGDLKTSASCGVKLFLLELEFISNWLNQSCKKIYIMQSCLPTSVGEKKGRKVY